MATCLLNTRTVLDDIKTDNQYSKRKSFSKTMDASLSKKYIYKKVKDAIEKLKDKIPAFDDKTAAFKEIIIKES